MVNKIMIVKPLAAAVGVAFVASLAFSSVAVADDNPFASTDLDSGYMMAGGKCGGDTGEEGSCGGDTGEEGSCGGDTGEEGSCGGDTG